MLVGVVHGLASSTANLTAAVAGEEIPAPHFDGPLRAPRLITELAAAVPEPASIALLSAGLLSLVADQIEDILVP